MAGNPARGRVRLRALTARTGPGRGHHGRQRGCRPLPIHPRPDLFSPFRLGGSPLCRCDEPRFLEGGLYNGSEGHID